MEADGADRWRVLRTTSATADRGSKAIEVRAAPRVRMDHQVRPDADDPGRALTGTGPADHTGRAPRGRIGRTTGGRIGRAQEGRIGQAQEVRIGRAQEVRIGRAQGGRIGRAQEVRMGRAPNQAGRATTAAGRPQVLVPMIDPGRPAARVSTLVPGHPARTGPRGIAKARAQGRGRATVREPPTMQVPARAPGRLVGLQGAGLATLKDPCGCRARMRA